jgi:hypothetical protein
MKVILKITMPLGRFSPPTPLGTSNVAMCIMKELVNDFSKIYLYLE